MNSMVMSNFSWRRDPSTVRNFAFSSLTNQPSTSRVDHTPINSRAKIKIMGQPSNAREVGEGSHWSQSSYTHRLSSIPEEPDLEDFENEIQNLHDIPSTQTLDNGLEESMETVEETTAVAESAQIPEALENAEDPLTLPVVEGLTALNLGMQNAAKPNSGTKTYLQGLSDQNKYQQASQHTEMGIVGTTLGASIAGPIGAIAGDVIGNLLPTTKTTVSTTNGDITL